MPSEIVVVDQSRAAACGAFDVVAARTGRSLHPLADDGTERGAEYRYRRGRPRGVLVIIDDDMFVERDWFGALVGALRAEGPRAVLTGRVLPDAAADSAKGFVPALVTAAGAPLVTAAAWPKTYLAGGHMAARRAGV